MIAWLFSGDDANPLTLVLLCAAISYAVHRVDRWVSR